MKGIQTFLSEAQMGRPLRENLHALKEKRLNGMPKTTPKSDQVIMLQNQYVREMRKYGVRGLRYDAAKHSKHEQIERSITPPLKN
ncbi:alpha amylase, partial [Escherichia coli]|nr:alpha amylase [Escherichia coli]